MASADGGRGLGWARADEANMKVLELMAESLQGPGLDAAPRAPTSLAALPRRPGRVPVVSHRATPPAAARKGPSAAATAVTLSRILAAVNGRIVALLLADASTDDAESARLELSLLVRLHRTLETHSARMADDVVLCDSIAEFAETVPAIMADLSTGGPRRLRRLLDHARDLLAEAAALGAASVAAELKPAMRNASAAVDAMLARSGADAVSERSLRPLLASTAQVHRRVLQELDRLCPRPQHSLLDDLAGR